MDRVEKVARAIWRTMACNPAGTRDLDAEFSNMAATDCAPYMDAARAAIAAIEADAREDTEMRKALIDAQTLLRFSFNRIHVLPRSRDTELADDIQRCLARIAEILNAAAICKGGEDER